MKYPRSKHIASLLLLTAFFPLGFAQSYKVKDLGAIGAPAETRRIGDCCATPERDSPSLPVDHLSNGR